jgi:type IV pilus assembly protein PilN
MYGLDINFLNDRPEYKPDKAKRTKTRTAAPQTRTPLILGLLAAVILPGIAVGLLLFLQKANADLEQEQAALDTQLGNLEAKRREIGNVNKQTKEIKAETEALATVFNTVKPWSALLQDIRDRVPANVRVTGITQAATTAKAPAPVASPSPGAAPVATLPQYGNITIAGSANDFNDVNDFLLVLQKSNFLQAGQTKLLNVEREQQSRKLEPLRLKNLPTASTSEDAPEIPRQVTFTIEAALNDVKASELLRELERKGAAGLVTRIKDLQERGVIQK